MKKKIFYTSAAICLFITTAACSSPSQNIYYKKGRHITDKIEVGPLDHIQYLVQVLQDKPFPEYCCFRLTYIESRKKLVTPLYENIEVSETQSYSPNTAELISDTMSFPLKILVGGRLAGEHIKTNKRVTGSLVPGETKSNGLVRMPPKPLSDTAFHASANGRPLERVYKTDSAGIIRLPAKSILDSYLMDGKVDINLRTHAVDISKSLPPDYLKKMLNLFYKLAW